MLHPIDNSNDTTIIGPGELGMGAIGGEELARWERMDEEMEGAGGGLEKISVSVRLRPLNEKEIARGENLDWECINDATIMFRNSGLERSMPPTAYTFDRVFRCESTTREVYEDGAKQVVLSVVSGINSTIFAYGQTSSGKTYTMNGITEYTVADIYDYIKRHEERAFVLKFSAIEIYNEAVRDLLAVESAPLRLLDDPERGTTVEKLTEEILEDWKHLQQLLCVCEAQRKIGETLLNEISSRSHQILRLTVESSAREFLGRDKSSTLVASVNFVDLAGSERASLALSSGTRLKEGCHINRSLLTLGTVIRKLGKGRNGHIPYRDSKLTRILQPALGGNARTAIICTICPAGSHMEQSRNTLLFASCAKEVMTSARVNVVMSDKALVKQLQKELAKLESELRYPGTASTTSNLEVLLREKDAQIKRMEKEINKVAQERDLAQSRLEGLLQLVGNDCASRQLEAFKNSKTNLPNECKDISSASNSSDTGYHGASVGSKKIYKSLGSSKHVDRYIDHPERLKKQDVLSPRNSISSSMFCERTLYHGEEETEQNISEEFDDHCKEVQCIETDEPIRSENLDMRFTAESRNLLSPVQSTPDHGNSESKPEKQMDMGARSSNPAFITLEQHLQNVRKTLDNLGKPYPTEISPWSLLPDVSSCKSLTLSKSRSCRENLMGNSSPWLKESENVDNTPPDSSHRDYSGRPEMFRRRRLALKYDAESEIHSRDGSEASEQSVSINSSRTVNTETGQNKDVATIGDFVAELKEMAQIHYHKQFIDGQDVDCSAKDVGLDPILSPMYSPSRWPLEFEKKQQQIIELWHECNVSLVHRTYFFILFKGDPLDSIYMEVEVRRLSFLKRTLRRGNLGKTTADGHNATQIASLKNLRRERAMLYRQMQKRMSPHERECAYTKSGIALDSKRRRLQLAHRLWTETGDMEHVRESASIVAKLIGLLESGEALKEMFSLSFTPQQSNQRSYSWKRGMSSLK